MDSTHVERAYAEIRRRIIEGEYPPGQPLSEVTLAQAHGMSRTPVREALSRLCHERYVERLSGRGFFVARVTVQAITETYEVRRLVEGWAAGRAAERATPEIIARLRALAERQDDEVTGVEAGNNNRRFHLAVAAAAGNHLAANLIEQTLAQIDRFITLGVGFAPFKTGSGAAHSEIVDAIEARNPDEARARMEEHLDRGLALMREAVVAGAFSSVSVT
jgi:DNA-binding GntR family transcriptional regulator